MIRRHALQWVGLAGMGGMLLLGACHTNLQRPQGFNEISLERMQGFPQGDTCFLKGVSALYAGRLGDRLVMAGGCNFPHVPAADKGRKVFYKGIYAAKMTDSAKLDWQQVGTLPEASAYGLTASVSEGMLCVGGTTEKGGLNKAFRLTLLKDTADSVENDTAKDVVLLDSLPSLPVTIDNLSGAVLHRTLYTIGGNVDGVPSAAVYALSLDSLSKGWTRLQDFPGGARLQTVCAAAADKLYVWGGFAPSVKGSSPEVFVDGYAYHPETNSWTPVAAPTDEQGHPVCLGGGVATTLSTGEILCTGGVNKDIFLKALQGVYAGKTYLSHPVAWYRFNPRFLVYQPATDAWRCVATEAAGARAGAAIVSYNQTHYLLQGELKPGIRSNEINRFKEK